MNEGAQPKRMLIPNLLRLLKEYSGPDHRLTQKQILELLEHEYGMTIDRKTLGRNLGELVDSGYPVCNEEVQRPGVGEGVIRTGWYLERDFEDSELRLLIDNLLFSKHIPYSQCKELIEKLEGLSNRYFRAKVKHVSNLPENQPANPQLFYTIELLDEAIGNERQVSFYYDQYGTDKVKRHRTDAEGNPRRYLVNPYQMVATNGRYYLIGNYDKFNNLSYYRLDRIADIELVKQPRKRREDIKGMEKGLDLPTMMAEHIYMFSGSSVHVRFRAPAWLADQIIDWFGLAAEFARDPDSGPGAGEETTLVRVKVNEKAFLFWALQYGRFVEVLEPAHIRAEIIKVIEEMKGRYGI